ncbi:DUF357 domain-containing protein [Nanoarchaeota archaeon NZ13-N]|uniref:DUF357 domain-containing protein n=1 Tax=Candidatus Nanoclepta minutus TaxID=1940235 RepID=A0A397WSM1_9ARCH|nr:MAG: DUF357 domain-containing protein [Nanoarchaeota archaeon NZ13-N]RIB35666.1 MAG: hypothetical protein BXU00_01015 [Candidatus Nanoclepta minutus]
MDAKNSSEELLSLLEREFKKLEEVFKKVNFLDKNLENFVKAYWEDCKYFYKNGEKIKAFELVNYIWGILDCMANRNLLEIPEDIRRWFKV